MVQRDETLLRRWSRRAVSFSLVFLTFILLLVLFPIWLPAALIFDAFRGTSWSTTRGFLFVAHYVLCQIGGMFFCIVIWLFSGAWAGLGRQRMIDWMWWLEFTWAKAFGTGTILIWRIRPKIESNYEFGDRPVILFVRHASIADTFIPLLYVCAPFNLRLRYVMKRELEWDPCIDVAINRLPSLFVRRGSKDSEKEIRAIGKLVEDVGPREGIIMFPEGTRFSEKKRARIIEKLEASGQTEILAWAKEYQHVLPPRMGGPLALLNSNPGADAVFCAHTGLEKSASFRESFKGGLVGSVVHIRFWGVPFEEIPDGDKARQTWLLGEWKKVDDYIASHREDDARNEDE